jgi:uncharacterized SAM-binding protein YcdF (DUF218 family)
MAKGKSKWLKWTAAVFLIFCLLCVAAYVFRGPLLRGLARAWIVNEPLTRADAIVVLGGGPETRPFEAARLFHLGLAPKILLMNPKVQYSTRLGLMPAEADVCRNVLLMEHVPTNAIFVSSEIVTNSFDESIVLRHWAKEHGVTRVIIPTDVFHTRRVRWIYEKECDSSGIHTEVEAVPVHEYTVADWWHHEEGIIAFQNEVLKYAYYRIKY